MQYFVWLAMMICVAGCAAPIADVPAVPEPVVQEPDSSETDMVEVDLAATETTFLDYADELGKKGSPPVIQRFTVITDTNGVVWQGITFEQSTGQSLLLKPMQGGGEMALLWEGGTSFVNDSQIFLAMSMPEVAQTAGLPDAEITFVRAKLSGDTWTFSVAVDHPDTGWEDYTDGWHVETPDGEILTTRILLHPHVGERPFTRSSSGFTIPADVTTVHVRSHDLISGYSTETVAVPIAEAGSGDRYEVVRD